MKDASFRRVTLWGGAGLLLVAAWFTYLIFFAPIGSDLPPPALERPVRSAPADFNWPLIALDDKPASFAQYKGRAVFLNIWATWCGPCIAEMPSIARLASNPRLKDVAFVCVSADASSDAVRTFLRDKSWPMTVFRANGLPEAFTTDGIPATFLIAPDGRIAAAEIGAADWSHPSAAEFLERLSRQAKAP